MSKPAVAVVDRVCPAPECPCRDKPGYVEARRKGGQTYYYFVHYWKQDGKRRIHKCYLGPVRYRYVEPFNELGLAGLTDKQRFVRYLRALLDRLSPEQMQWLREEVMRVEGDAEG
jgi:hypothetical protein